MSGGYIGIQGSFIDSVIFEQKYYIGKNGEVAEFWIFKKCWIRRMCGRLDTGCERRKGVKSDFEVWGLSSQRD